jgi:hypothetical protein
MATPDGHEAVGTTDMTAVTYLRDRNATTAPSEGRAIRAWVRRHLPRESRVLNLCCGPTRLSPPTVRTEIVRVDSNPEIDANHHGRRIQ